MDIILESETGVVIHVMMTLLVYLQLKCRLTIMHRWTFKANLPYLLINKSSCLEHSGANICNKALTLLNFC